VLLRLLKQFGRRGGAAPQAATPPPPQRRFADRLSLILPSVAGRGALFERALRHLAACKVRWPVLVTDHSAPERAGELAAIAARYPQLDLKILRHAPEAHFLERLVNCARAAGTQYVALHADDDFMFPAGAEACIEYLDAHPDYAACKGRMAAFSVAKPPPGVSEWAELGTEAQGQAVTHIGRTRAEDDLAARLLNHVANFNPTLYAVHRREVFIDAYGRAREINENVIFWQYLASCLTLSRGKLRTLDEPYYLRLDNATGWRSQLIARRDPSHWPFLALAPDFSAQLAQFRSTLAELLLAPGNAALEREALLDEACIWLLRRALCGSGRDPIEDYEKTFISRLHTEGSAEHDLLRYCLQCVTQSA